MESFDSLWWLPLLAMYVGHQFGTIVATFRTQMPYMPTETEIQLKKFQENYGK